MPAPFLSVALIQNAISDLSVCPCISCLPLRMSMSPATSLLILCAQNPGQGLPGADARYTRRINDRACPRCTKGRATAKHADVPPRGQHNKEGAASRPVGNGAK